MFLRERKAIFRSRGRERVNSAAVKALMMPSSFTTIGLETSWRMAASISWGTAVVGGFLAKGGAEGLEEGDVVMNSNGLFPGRL